MLSLYMRLMLTPSHFASFSMLRVATGSFLAILFSVALLIFAPHAISLMLGRWPVRRSYMVIASSYR